jgi:hypothetical protein
VRFRDLTVAVGRVGFATATVVAMTYQFATLKATLPTFSLGNFFSFFTIQSNILAALTLVATALVRRSERTPLFDAARSAITLYIAITGAVFALLLSGHQESLDTHIDWVDSIVHEVIPIVVVLDWLLDPPRHRVGLPLAAAWLAYPLVWFAYTLGRGAAEGWYPYPFVDVSQVGYGGVLWRSAIMLAAFAAAAAAVAILGNTRAEGGRRAIESAAAGKG